MVEVTRIQEGSHARARKSTLVILINCFQVKSYFCKSVVILLLKKKTRVNHDDLLIWYKYKSGWAKKMIYLFSWTMFIVFRVNLNNVFRYRINIK